MKPKLRFLRSSLSKSARNIGLSCPSCGCPKSTTVDRKRIILTLRRCNNCKLLFRAPTTTSEENAEFYQQEYSQGFTTDMPSQHDLQVLIDTAFEGSEKDYTTYLSVLDALGCRPGDAVLDFGCSWGYGSWQLTRAGFDVEAFEISKPRCAYAREQLGVNAVDTLGSLRGSYDVIFSAHVLEHVPSVAETIAFAWKMLRPGGLFVAFTPNGSQSFRKAHPSSWHLLWGMVHPQFLDNVFYKQTLGSSPYLLASTPYGLSEISSWSGTDVHELNLSGIELLAAVRKV